MLVNSGGQDKHCSGTRIIMNHLEDMFCLDGMWEEYWTLMDIVFHDVSWMSQNFGRHALFKSTFAKPKDIS